MYKVKLNNEILYHPNAEDDKKIIEGKFTESLNKSGAFEFKVSQDNTVYKKVQKMKDHIYLYRYNKPGKEKLLFEGRVVSDTKDFDNIKDVACEGALGYLLDSIQRPYTYQCVMPEELFQNLIAGHNEMVSEDKQFLIGVVDVEGGETKVTENGYPNTFDDIEDKLINVYGGYISVRYEDSDRYIDYKKESGRVLDKPIRFGVNMMDLEEVIEAGDVKTVIIPIGNENSATGKPVTIKTVNNDIDYLENTEAVRLFGRIEGVLKVDSDSPREILSAGQEEISSISNMVVSVEVTAVDIADTGIDIEDIRAGDWIPVISKKHGIDSVMQVISREIDIMNPENSKITLGASIRTLTRTQDKEENSIRKEMTALKETSDGKIEEAKVSLGELQAAQDDLKQTIEEGMKEIKEEAGNAQTIAESAKTAADKATQDAEEAKTAAEDANNAAAIAQENAQLSAEAAKDAQEAADIANANAEDAKVTADAAQEAADEANAQVTIINSEITSIKEDQADIRNDMAAEITTVKETMEASYAKKTDISDTEMELRAEISKSAAEIQMTMESDYAKKTELTAVQSSLQTQITQNAQEISSTASAVETVQIDAAEAQSKAEEAVQTATEAQNTAQTAVSAAQDAQESADAATLAAQTAQTEATKARSEADTAKQAAEDAKAVADAAQTDLDAAKQNLTNVTNRVDATEEEIAAAQAAVDAAQQKADEANASAAEAQAAADAAQASADTAKQNAATAQKTADTAKQNAATAQAAADEAKAEADKANAAVGNLANTVTDMQTQISQNAEAIELRATKTEVQEYLSGYSTKEETESAINLASASIRAEVNASIGAISGGDNILRGTNVEKELVEDGTWTTGQWKLRGTGTATSYVMTDSPVSSLNIAWTIKGAVYPAKYGGIQQTQITIEPGTYTVSVWAKNTSADSTLSAQLALYLGNGQIGSTISVGKNWGRYSTTFSTESESITIAFYNPSGITSTDICGMTLNKGDVDSGWTPATYDIGDTVTTLRAALELKVDKTSLISEINASANVITLTGNRFVVESDNFSLAEDGTITATNAAIEGTINATSITAEGKYSIYNQEDFVFARLSRNKTTGVTTGAVSSRIMIGKAEHYAGGDITNHKGISFIAPVYVYSSIEETDSLARHDDSDVVFLLSESGGISCAKIDLSGAATIGGALQCNNNAAVSGTLTVSGTTTLGLTALTGTCRPSANATGNIDLGSSAYPFYNAYLSHCVYYTDPPSGGGTAIYINSNGALVKYSSDRRLKNNIEAVASDELNPERLYDLPIWQYKYNSDVLEDGDDLKGKTVIGFMADEVASVYPRACAYDKDGVPTSWNPNVMIPAMLALIQKQKQEIEELRALI